MFSRCSRFVPTSGRRLTASFNTFAAPNAAVKATGARPGSSSILALTTAAAAATLIYAASSPSNANVTHLDSRIPSSGDVISAGTPIKEPATGILFPPLCNGYSFVGCGVRVKYGFVKVYAVGTYVDFLSMSPIKHSPERVEAALLDPNYPRTIRIVMNRNLGIDKYTSAIVEALQPRMMGQDLDKYVPISKLTVTICCPHFSRS
jgi:hypothetical protein